MTYEQLLARAKARREHAFLLRCEGLTYAKIADALGFKDRTRAMTMVRQFAKEMNRAIRKAKLQYYRKSF